MVVEVKQGGGEKKGQAKKRGLWKPEEDLVLRNYVEAHGEGNWATVSAKSGLKRGGKSCRLRWKNYLRPNIKRGEMSEQEQDLIVRMHKLVGNRVVADCWEATRADRQRGEELLEHPYEQGSWSRWQQQEEIERQEITSQQRSHGDQSCSSEHWRTEQPSCYGCCGRCYECLD
ncbi:unnamed protein product [Linum tenue]|uniref:Uncharacterized protein n=1 Tax=Linum tenue TaxID=586396 RepID=A0AAV0HWI1_9ROSI|nr:unnamed protein product [Linum tenue]